MSRKKKKVDDLDTETTFADMNVDGFRWYDPKRKANPSPQKTGKKEKIPFKEYLLMARAAFAAAWPFFAVLIVSFVMIWLLAYLWLS